jgi:hypothetical protein
MCACRVSCRVVSCVVMKRVGHGVRVGREREGAAGIRGPHPAHEPRPRGRPLLHLPHRLVRSSTHALATATMCPSPPSLHSRVWACVCVTLPSITIFLNICKLCVYVYMYSGKWHTVAVASTYRQSTFRHGARQLMTRTSPCRGSAGGGQMWAWGDGASGQLGHGTEVRTVSCRWPLTIDRPTDRPTNLFSPGSGWVIAGGGARAATGDGLGAGQHHRRGRWQGTHGRPHQYSHHYRTRTPTHNHMARTHAHMARAHGTHARHNLSCDLTLPASSGQGEVWTWGDGSDGQLGHGAAILRYCKPLLIESLKGALKGTG